MPALSFAYPNTVDAIDLVERDVFIHSLLTSCAHLIKGFIWEPDAQPPSLRFSFNNKNCPILAGMHVHLHVFKHIDGKKGHATYTMTNATTALSNFQLDLCELHIRKQPHGDYIVEWKHQLNKDEYSRQISGLADRLIVAIAKTVLGKYAANHSKNSSTV